MRLQSWRAGGCSPSTAIGLLVVSACGTNEPDPADSPKTTGSEPEAGARSSRTRFPASELAAVMAAHYKGLGHMERYEYREAIEAFRDVRKRAPGWIPGSINLAIALLNDSGVKAEEAKKAGSRDRHQQLRRIAGSAGGRAGPRAGQPVCAFLSRHHPPADRQDHLLDAHGHFKRVTEIDPTDAAAWYWLASTVSDPERCGDDV